MSRGRTGGHGDTPEEKPTLPKKISRGNNVKGVGIRDTGDEPVLHTLKTRSEEKQKSLCRTVYNFQNIITLPNTAERH